MQIQISLLIGLLSSPFLLLTVKILTFIFKAIFIGALIRFKLHAKVPHRLWMFITILLLSHTVIDLSWIVKLLKFTLFPSLSSTVALALIRISWASYVIEQLALAFFIDQLISPTPVKWTKYKAFQCYSGLLLLIVQLAVDVMYFSQYESPDVQSILFKLNGFSYLYCFMVLIPTLYCALSSLRSRTLPKIVAAQLKTFMQYMIIPHVFLEFASLTPLALFLYNNEIYPFVSLSTLLLTYGLYFSSQRIIKLRFLNVRNHIEIKYDSNFIQNFKDILEQLAHVTTLNQVRHITQNFFKQELEIPPGHTFLFVRTLERDQLANKMDEETIGPEKHYIYLSTENMLSRLPENEAVREMIYQLKVLIRDELEFTNFYQQDPTIEALVGFLKSINSDVFVPIYDRQSIIAYITVEHDARPKRFFSYVDRDEMLIFATYLGNIINLLNHNNLQAMLKEQKEIKEELYQKHQEVNQYKESLRSFLRTTRERRIGIIFYRSKKFSYGNQAAQELLGVDLNRETGYELTQILKKIARNVQEYKAAQSVMTKDTQGNKLVVAGIPSLDNSYVIITVYYPEIADTLRDRLDILKDPSAWDYALYLETTQSGQLINKLIPGSGETLLNFKVNLLKAALSKKAIFLDMPDEDLHPTAEIIHHISLRSELHILKLTVPEKNHEVALKLFGINPLFDTSLQEPPFLEKLNDVGTLFIENIDLLSLETQHALAEFINYGFFKPLRSDRKSASNVRIICSSPRRLEVLAQEGVFSPALLQELAHTTVSLPSLVSLHQNELHELMDGYVEQTLKAQELKNLLDLNAKERERIIDQGPLISLQEFREHIHYSLVQKSNKKNISEITFDSSYAITDPELSYAARLGKHALKDTRIMTMLWNKFKNQTKIATFLGVNRSSVNRRCKEYNLE